MVARRLAQTYLDGRTVKVVLTQTGQRLAAVLSERQEFGDLAARSRLVSKAVGDYTATKLKDFIYEVFPEITTMKWGEEINL